MCQVSYYTMRRPWQISSLLLILSLLLHEVVVSGKPSCPAGHFRNMSASPLVHCSPCSTCTINHIVRKPCNRQNDTVCGPFYEFEFFNQRQQKASNDPLSEGALSWKLRGGDRPAKDAEAAADGEDKYGYHHLVYGQQTTNSPDEAASTLRCGHSGSAAAAEWRRVLCYGLVAAVVIVISVALSAVALFSYCRANAKTLCRVSAAAADGASRSTSAIVTDADPSSAAAASTTTTIVVDRSVRHLEEQLFHNERRRAFLRWLFGSSAAADRLFSSNDYLEERHRRRFLLLLEPSTSGRRPTDAVPLQPYPGMISTGRTDHDRSPPPSTDADTVSGDDGVSEDTEIDNRLDRTPRSDEVQTDEQGTSHGERSLLIPDQ